MTTSEEITLVLSVVALLVSLATAVISARRQSVTDQRDFREQMTGIVARVIDAMAVLNRIHALAPAERTPADGQLDRMETQRLAALVRQADYLIEPDTAQLLSDVDYLTLAEGFGVSATWSTARSTGAEPWTRAARPSTGPPTSGCTRGGSCAPGREREAREHFQASAQHSSEIAGALGDTAPFQRGFSYEMWMSAEASAGHHDEGALLADRAREAYGAIAQPAFRERKLYELDALRASLRTPRP